jgi:hypothetical protein
MAINNNPIKSTVETFKQMNQVVKTTVEATADLFHDADGDKTDLDDIKREAGKLSGTEQVALTVGTIATGGALPVLSLLTEGAVTLTNKAAKEVGSGLNKAGEAVSQAVKDKYSNPPEKPLADKLGKELKKAGDKIEEAVDDLKDGRTYRDVKKEVKRGIRDNFTEQTPLQKVGSQLRDGFEDAIDNLSDIADDIQDGRMGKKIRKAFDD